MPKDLGILRGTRETEFNEPHTRDLGILRETRAIDFKEPHIDFTKILKSFEEERRSPDSRLEP